MILNAITTYRLSLNGGGGDTVNDDMILYFKVNI